MKNYKYYLFCLLLFVSSTVFAETTWINQTPSGFVAIGNSGSVTFITETPNGYTVIGNRGEVAFVNRTPNGYVSMGNNGANFIITNDRNRGLDCNPSPYTSNYFNN